MDVFFAHFALTCKQIYNVFTMICEDFIVTGKNSAIPFSIFSGCKLGPKLKAVGPGSDVKEDVFLYGT